MTRRIGGFCLIVLGAAVLLALLSPLASSRPDGLERVMRDHRAAGQETPAARSPLADYKLPGVRNEKWATVLAAVLGTLATFCLALGAGWFIGRKRRQEAKD